MSQSNVPSSFDSTSTLTVAAPVLAEAVFTGVVTAPAAAAPPAAAATTDPVLSGSDSEHLSDGKFAEGNATWTRATNILQSTLHVETPYLFVAARGTVTTTIYADTPFGPYPLWQVSHDLTACAKWDPTCSSNPSQTWDDQPSTTDWQKIQQYGSFMTVDVGVR